MVLSREASIAKKLFLVDIIFGIISILLVIFGFGYFDFTRLGMSRDFAFSLVAILVSVSLMGLVVIYYAYMKAKKFDIYNAGIYGLVGSLVPPLRILSLIGAVLCFISKEGKAVRMAHKKGKMNARKFIEDVRTGKKPRR